MEAREINLSLYISLLILPVLANFDNGESQFCEIRDEYSSEDPNCSNHDQFSNKRYILYDVNPPEGFNLRRDVYIRASIFVKNLIEENNGYEWRLVLPPWGNLYHWKSTDVGYQRQIPWGRFFDIKSLRKFVPVIEMYEFFKEYSPGSKTCSIDRLYVLQNDDEMFKTGDFRDRNDIVDCPSSKHPAKFWGYSNITAREIRCLIFHGTMSGLSENLKPEIHRSVMFDHMEIPLHDSYGSKEYWEARRSMRYNSALYAIANDYRRRYLGSNDLEDRTKQPIDWREEKENRNSVGGPYLCAHLRRGDFLIGRGSSVPTIKNAAFQLREKLKELDLKVVFVATDGDEHEFKELKSHLKDYQVYKYTPNQKDKYLYKDGGVAIVDQIICSRARYFIGTHESTFTFRIQEDREIIGFPSKTTFNRFCAKEKKCKSGGSWKIVWR